MEIPGVGCLHVKGGIAAVKFQAQFIQNTKGIAKRPLSERKQKGEMKLTSQNLEILNYQNQIKSQLPTQIDETGLTFMKNNYDLSLHDDMLKSFKSVGLRPYTAGSRPKRDLGTSLLEKTLGVPKLNKIVNDTNSQTKTFIRPLTDIEYSLKRIKLWIRQNKYKAEDVKKTIDTFLYILMGDS